jgi:PAS domain S-box-containing protein
MPELSSSSVRSLLIGDEDTYNAVRTLLPNVPARKHELEWAPTISSFLQIKAKRSHDIYLLDHLACREHLPRLASEIVSEDSGTALIILADTQEKLEADCSAFKSAPAVAVIKDQMSGPYLERSIISAIERRKMTLALSRANRYWMKIFEGIPDAISIIGKDYLIQRINKTMARKLGTASENIIGKPCYEVVHNCSEPPGFCPFSKLLKDGQEYSAEVYEQNLGGHCVVSVSPLVDDDGRLIGAIHVARDISHRKKAAQALLEINESLERLVGERTSELVEKTKHLAELNTTLKVLLQHREQERTELHNSIALGIKTNILPYLNGIMQSSPTQRQIEFVTMIKNSLGNILSSHFNVALADGSIGLSPAQIRVAGMVRDGMSNKEIADALFISEGTVRTHREHIRKKLGLNKQKINLRAHLLSLR